MLKVEDVDLTSIIPYARNPRKNEKAVSAVAGSIKEFGFRQPIVVDEEMVIIAGHTRLSAAQSLNMTKVPVHVAEGLSDAQKKAYRLADNRVSEDSEWDYEMLELEFKELAEMDFDLSTTGFSGDELDRLMTDKTAGLTDPDAVPEPPEEPITKPGDLWILGNHRLLCGDATIQADVERLMDGVKPDLIHTDPPYGMNAVSKSGVLSANYKNDIIGDDDANTAKAAFLLTQKLYPKSKQIWWGANYYCSALPDSECWLVWDKNNGQSDQTDCELAWANFRSVVRQFTQSSEKIGRVHPTQKPAALMEWIIKRFKVTSKTIADYFAGSGSTLIAAEMSGINGYMMELDPTYCDVIVKRWEDFTGLKAELLEKQEAA